MAHRGDPEKYVNTIVMPQVREILTHYGDIAILWWDIPGGVINKARADRIEQLVLQCNPHIILNNRLGGGYHGDTETPEQFIPPTGFPGRDWESCMTMNHTWGTASWTTTGNRRARSCIIFAISPARAQLFAQRRPHRTGRNPRPQPGTPARDRPSWLKANGEAIYGARASISRTPDWGRVTTRRLPDGDTRLYAIVFQSPKDGMLGSPA